MTNCHDSKSQDSMNHSLFASANFFKWMTKDANSRQSDFVSRKFNGTLHIWSFTEIAKIKTSQKIILRQQMACSMLTFHLCFNCDSYHRRTWIFLFQLRMFDITVQDGRNCGVLPQVLIWLPLLHVTPAVLLCTRVIRGHNWGSPWHVTREWEGLLWLSPKNQWIGWSIKPFFIRIDILCHVRLCILVTSCCGKINVKYVELGYS